MKYVENPIRYQQRRCLGVISLAGLLGTMLLAMVSMVATATSASAQQSVTRATQRPWVDQLEYPNDIGNLHAVSCPSSLECVTVGDASVSSGILLTTDGGSAWHPARVPSVPGGLTTLLGVSCPTITVCFVVGDSSNGVAILNTDDQAISWSLQSPPSGLDKLNGISCPTSSMCIAVGDTVNSGGVAIITTDGGADWSYLTNTPVVTSFQGVDCTSTNDCWLVGYDQSGGSSASFTSDTPVMFSTTNGGNSWNQVDLPTQSSGMPDGWYVQNDALASISCNPGGYCAASGVMTYGIPSCGIGSSPYQPCESGQTPTYTYYYGGLVMYLSSAGPTASSGTANGGGSGGGSGSSGTASSTSDGWTAVATSSATAFFSVSCAPTGTQCWAVGNLKSSQYDTTTGVVFATTNGSSWATQQLPNGVNSLAGVDCFNAPQCFAVGGASYAPSDVTDILYTPNGGISSDGGSTWFFQSQVGSITGVSCPTATDCWAVGNDSFGAAFIVATTNAGATWSPQIIPSGGNFVHLSGISCANTQSCIVVGTVYHVSTSTYNGAIFATSDGGANWTNEDGAVPSGTTGLSAVACPTASDCFATGSTAVGIGIIGTKDGGSSWTALTTFQGKNLTGIACPNSTNCWTTGQTLLGPIMNTTDGGSTWSVQGPPLFSISSLNGVSCTSVQICLAVGTQFSGAAIVSTTNGGSTWSPQSLPLGLSSMNAISCIPGTANCWAVGGSSIGVAAAIHTSDNGQSWSAPVAMPSGVDSLSAVSCASITACWATGASTEFGYIVASPPPTSLGYWILSSNGSVFGFGNAPYYGSAFGLLGTSSAVSMVSSPEGKGYWILSSNGSVFGFGEVVYYGSPIDIGVTAFDICSIAPSPDGNGYWILAADGGVWGFGDSQYLGDLSNAHLPFWVVDIVSNG